MTAATNLAVKTSAGGPKPTVNGPEIGRVCPSVCPNDWDKRKTLAVRDCLAEPYDERLQRERRGQDSRPAGQLRCARCSNCLDITGFLRFVKARLVASFCQCFVQARHKSATKFLSEFAIAASYFVYGEDTSGYVGDRELASKENLGYITATGACDGVAPAPQGRRAVPRSASPCP
jgi:hypothetical protein